MFARRDPRMAPSRACWDELTRLLAEPIIAGDAVFRRGELLVVSASGENRGDPTAVDVSISFRAARLALPSETEETTDAAALDALSKVLADTDYHARIAACEALGQLGGAEAKRALVGAQTADHPEFRRAVARALVVADAPRLAAGTFADLACTLQTDDGSLLVGRTNVHGRVVFRAVPLGRLCRVSITEAAATYVEGASVALAALATKSDTPGTQEPEPRARFLEIGTGVGPIALCTIYQDEAGRLIAECRVADLAQLRGGALRLRIRRGAEAEVSEHRIDLAPDWSGKLAGRVEIGDGDIGYEIEASWLSLPNAED
jgi:hypothetical protein